MGTWISTGQMYELMMRTYPNGQASSKALTILYRTSSLNVTICEPPAPCPLWLSWLSMKAMAFCGSMKSHSPSPKSSRSANFRPLLPRNTSPMLAPYLNSVTLNENRNDLPLKTRRTKLQGLDQRSELIAKRYEIQTGSQRRHVYLPNGVYSSTVMGSPPRSITSM